MGWVTAVEEKSGDGKIQPTQFVAYVKVFTTDGDLPILQIDTHGANDRAIPGKQSQTMQFGREAAQALFQILKRTYDFK